LEAVATVVAVGPGVTSCKPGDKVCHCTPPIGSYAEEQIYPADQLIGVPDGLGLSDAELASLLLKGLTARFLLRETYRVQPGDSVLIHAAAGGMGHLLCPWANHLGATVIVVDRVREITNGEGVHVVYESIGKATLKRSLKCLRVRGMCAAYGHASGAPDPVDIVEELGVPGSLFITRPALFHYVTPRSALLAAADDLFQAVRQGVVKSTIATTFPLSEAADAHRFIEARKTTGSIVLMP
jgi:NADPH2:quinone reductase